MIKFAALIIFLLMQSCAANNSYFGLHEGGYFLDASSCYRSSERKVSVKVPSGLSMTVVDVAIGNDSNVFGLCMKQLGHPPTQANPEDYLNVSRACFQEARDSSSPDETYANCVQHGRISAEIIPPEHSK
ncbi:MAG: hypothetical protein ABL919_05865 [Methylococcales bacterium]|nr:hypothetical protein [Methylococcaceae bacterium]